MRCFCVEIVAPEKQRCLLRNVELQEVNYFFEESRRNSGVHTNTSVNYAVRLIIPHTSFFENAATIQF